MRFLQWLDDLFEDPPWFEKFKVEALGVVLTLITLGWMFAPKYMSR